MSEEEKKAIERIKNFGDSISCATYPPEAYIEMKDDIEDILYLIETQQKEIEELKNIETNKIAIIDKDKYISKGKIRAKIEELEKEQENNRKSLYNAINILYFKEIDKISNRISVNMAVQDILKSLLEEE